ncbi:MAG TPA: serine protease [Thermoanaerobaculia bacterium]|nr:serine protease [Thermoanaerobaculia bacterium]
MLRHRVLAIVLNLTVFAVFGQASAGRAQSMGPAFMPSSAAIQKSSAPARLRLEQALGQAPLHILRPAVEGAIDQVQSLQAWNATGRLPFKNGFARPLPQLLEVRLSSSSAGHSSPVAALGGYLVDAEPGWLAWGTHIQVGTAYRLRLHLAEVRLPPGTRMVVSGLGGSPQEFGLELLAPGGDLWTPSVAGESLLFEARVPVKALAGTAAAGFVLREVLELVDLAPAQGGAFPGTVSQKRAGAAPSSASGSDHPAAVSSSCLVDAMCTTDNDLPNVASYRAAIAQLQFIDNGASFLCSGGLLNDQAQDGIPYLLTAHHCLSDQAAASSLEAFFDYETTRCNGAAPKEDAMPRSNGATLLATGASSDFTFVKLLGAPGKRAFLGWNADPAVLQANTPLFRLSHPVPGTQVLPQTFTKYALTTTPPKQCEPADPNSIFLGVVSGATFPGSSGAPLLLANGQVVGQLHGGCGPNPDDACNYANLDFDGAFFVTYRAIRQWLTPNTATGPCVASSSTLCIDDKPGDRRFSVQVDVHTTQGGGHYGPGTASQLSPQGSDHGGLFWFFAQDNPEILVKVLNGCGLTSHFWVFYAATTNVGFTIAVTDTATGAQATYNNADSHAAAPVQDTNALPCG